MPERVRPGKANDSASEWSHLVSARAGATNSECACPGRSNVERSKAPENADSLMQPFCCARGRAHSGGGFKIRPPRDLARGKY